MPWRSFTVVALLTVTTMGCSNASLMYLNYPTQLIFKSCKPLPVMIGGVLIQRKRYTPLNFLGAALMCAGLVVFTLADVHTHPEFDLVGVAIVCAALAADAAIGNVQEQLMRQHGVSGSELIFRSYSIGTLVLGAYCLTTGELQSGIAISVMSPLRTTLLPVLLFSLAGYFGVTLVLMLVRMHGAFVAVTVTNMRKLLTIVLSFLLFPKPFLFQYLWGGLMVVAGLWLAGKKMSDGPKLPTTRGEAV